MKRTPRVKYNIIVDRTINKYDKRVNINTYKKTRLTLLFMHIQVQIITKKILEKRF